MAWSTPILLLLAMELRAVFVADAGQALPIEAFTRLRRYGLTLAALVLTVLLAWHATRLGAAALIVLYGGVFATRWLLSWTELYWGVMQKRGDWPRFNLSNSLRGVAGILPFAIALPLAAGATGIQTAAAASVAVQVALWWGITAFVDAPVLRALDNADSRSSRADDFRLLRSAAPMGIVALLINLSENAPRIVIDLLPGGPRDLGYFGALALIPLTGQFLVVQLALAAAHRLATYHLTDRPRFWRLARRLIGGTVLLGAGVFAVTWLCGAWLLRVMYTPEYVQYLPEFLLLVAGQCVLLLGSMFGAIVTQMQRFWVQVPVQMAVLTATSLAAWAWIPANPVGGGAWTMMVRSGVQTGMYGICLLVELRRSKPRNAA